MKDIQIEGFKKTLDPVTVRYLEEKLESQTRVDLRRVTEKAANELRQLENEAAYDYLKIEKETKSLISEIDFSDRILNNLEGLLKDSAGEKVANLQAHQRLAATSSGRAHLPVQAGVRRVVQLEQSLFLNINRVNQYGHKLLSGRQNPIRLSFSSINGRPQTAQKITSAVVMSQATGGSAF